MNNILGFLLLILLFCFLAGPFILTLFNIINLFKNKKIKPNLIDSLTFIFGILLTILLYWYCQFMVNLKTSRLLPDGIPSSFCLWAFF